MLKQYTIPFVVGLILGIVGSIVFRRWKATNAGGR